MSLNLLLLAQDSLLVYQLMRLRSMKIACDCSYRLSLCPWSRLYAIPFCIYCASIFFLISVLLLGFYTL